jgi:oxygen-independent coproporphyrinogen-3 oxidase
MNKLTVLQRGLGSNFEIDNLLEVFVLKADLMHADDDADYLNKLALTNYGLSIVHDSETIEIQMIHAKVLETRTLFVLAHEPKMLRVLVKKNIYELLSNHFEPLSKWGILVGIRPVKIVHELMDEGMPLDAIKLRLETLYHIDRTKVNLMTEVAIKERDYLYPNDPDAISLYLCIPFCPTRCLYCSFPSNDMKQKGKLLPEYLEKLEIETIHAINHIKSLGKRIDCIYIGGGTPTSISAAQLKTLLGTIKNHIDLSTVKEYTVEAGRPDTITLEKLEIMKAYGVDRICVNPQTMDEKTLITIGRAHDASSITDVMKMARDVGFKTINMDLILGLPGETVVNSSNTIEKLLEMSPENITIHTLAVKRASRLNEDLDLYELSHDAVVEEMLDHADRTLRTHNISPYYMYRQKKMIGHLENVGYAKIGHESLYNMRIMEEKHTIIACGAGAVSKLCAPEENRFERVANFKGLEDYLNRFDEILEKKTLLK